MKKFVTLIFVFILYVASADVCLAKQEKGLDLSQPSVQLLKNLVDEGKEVRKNEESLQKADLEADTIVIRSLKQKYLEENRELLEIGKEK